MADNEASQEAAEPVEGEETPGETPEQAEIDWKAEARKHERRAKENLAAAKANEAAAQRLAAIEESSKTEAQKTAERIAALEAENASFKTREQISAWKAEVAEATGVPAGVLAGSTLEEITAHAESLKPLIQSPPTPAGPVVPTEGTGAPGVGQLSESDLKTMSPKQINEARRAGRLNNLLGIS